MISVHTKVFFKNLIDIDKDKDTIEKELYEIFKDSNLIYTIDETNRFLFFEKKYKKLELYKLLIDLGSRRFSNLEKTVVGYAILNDDRLSEDTLISLMTFEFIKQ